HPSGLSRDAALCDTHQAVQTAFHAVIYSPLSRDASSTPTEQDLTAKHNSDVARSRHSSIAASAAAAVATWTRTLISTSTARPVVPVFDRKLRLGVSLAAACVLDARVAGFSESITQSTEYTEYNVLRACAHLAAAAADHDLLDEPPLLARHPNGLGSWVDDVVIILARREAHRKLQQERHVGMGARAFAEVAAVGR
ncbi:hypothetical protein RB213_012124, partial [Colletotrichum asianum]